MKRSISLDEISDGKLYELNDMVKAECGDCKGCSVCCHGMGNSIVLDPLDVHRLMQGMKTQDFNMLLSVVELNVVDGIILPNLKMIDSDERCTFLDKDGRCEMHAYRPGICRIFPLGRYYAEEGFQYFLQIHECKNDKRTKVKIKKWIDTPDVKRYDTYISDWHYFLKKLEMLIKDSSSDEEIRKVNMYVLNTFFVTPYQENMDFYEQFYIRLNSALEQFGK